MSIMDCDSQALVGPARVELPAVGRSLHRVGAVRRLQGVSRRTVARFLNTDVAAVRQQEEETTDMSLSDLYRWQEALEVPVGELLVESDGSLSAPILQRAQLVRLMKTALAMMENATKSPMKEMSETLVEQLVAIMPELREVSSWHAVGKRRSRNELGAAAERSLSEDIFLDRSD